MSDVTRHTEIEAARERMALNARRCGIPEYMIDGLIRYVFDRVPPGSFLMAVLENNLMRAMECADETNSRCLKAYAMFLYNYVPMSCKGSPEKVEAWLSRKPDDAELGMVWWNNLPEHSRAAWLREAKSDVPADAWAAYKATISDEDDSRQVGP